MVNRLTLRFSLSIIKIPLRRAISEVGGNLGNGASALEHLDK